MRTINQVLDRALMLQNVRSDYKLGLCLGIGAQSLSNYRLGKTLPDEKACIKLAWAMGEDPALLTCEIQAQRSKDDETRALWISIAKRLQNGFSTLKMLLLIAIVSIAAIALPAWAATYAACLLVQVNSLYIVEYWKRVKPGLSMVFVKVCKVARLQLLRAFSHVFS